MPGLLARLNGAAGRWQPLLVVGLRTAHLAVPLLYVQSQRVDLSDSEYSCWAVKAEDVRAAWARARQRRLSQPGGTVMAATAGCPFSALDLERLKKMKKKINLKKFKKETKIKTQSTHVLPAPVLGKPPRKREVCTNVSIPSPAKRCKENIQSQRTIPPTALRVIPVALIGSRDTLRMQRPGNEDDISPQGATICQL